mgnify:CR=1 FL=1
MTTVLISPTLNFQTPLFALTDNEAILIFAFSGLLIGSFLNVIIYRLPLIMEAQWDQQARDFLELPGEKTAPLSLTSPGSQCPNCQHHIKPYENIPVFSWLFLARKCSQCQQSISWRYPFVELLTAVLSAIVAFQMGITVESLVVLVLTFHLIALALIDFDHHIIPDNLVLPLLWLILVLAAIGSPQSASASIIGAAVGYLSFWSVSFGYKLVRHKDGMGHGDFKLLAVFGAISGWQAIFTTISLAAIIGLLFALPVIVKKNSLQTAIPFGPAIAIAGWVTLLFKPWVTFY